MGPNLNLAPFRAFEGGDPWLSYSRWFKKPFVLWGLRCSFFLILLCFPSFRQYFRSNGPQLSIYYSKNDQISGKNAIMLHFATDGLFPSFAIFSYVNGFSDFCFKFGLKITM